MTNCFWNDTAVFFRNELGSLGVVRPHHGVRLSTSCLSVSEHGPIVSLNNVFNQTKRALVVDFLLLRLNAVHHVEGESPRVFVFLVGIDEANLSQLLVNNNNALGSYKVKASVLTHVSFFAVHRSRPDHYFNGFCWLRHWKLLTI